MTRRISRKDGCACDDRVQHVKSLGNDVNQKNEKYDNPNHFLGGNSLSHFDRVEPIIKKPVEPTKHPIVNLCEPYIESVFYQYDCFPMTNGEMIWNNDKIGRIINLTYYLDSSMGDAVTVYIEKISPNGHVENLLNTPQNGNNYIKGTFNSTVLTFKLNMKIKNDDDIKIRFENASVNDCTIMASMDIKYGEEDFETRE
jgi:hypothetical protein